MQNEEEIIPKNEKVNCCRWYKTFVSLKIYIKDDP